MRLNVCILEPIGQFPRLCEERGRKMFPKLKVMRNRSQDEGTPSRHPRRGTRAAALIMLGGGVAGLWSAPMAHAASHDALKTFRSSATFTVTKDDADADWANFKDDAGDKAEFKDDAADDDANFKDGAGDWANSKDDGDDDWADSKNEADDDWADFKDDAGYDLWDFLDDGLHITVNVNNNNNNNGGATKS